MATAQVRLPQASLRRQTRGQTQEASRSAGEQTKALAEVLAGIAAFGPVTLDKDGQQQGGRGRGGHLSGKDLVNLALVMAEQAVDKQAAARERAAPRGDAVNLRRTQEERYRQEAANLILTTQHPAPPAQRFRGRSPSTQPSDRLSALLAQNMHQARFFSDEKRAASRRILR